MREHVASKTVENLGLMNSSSLGVAREGLVAANLEFLRKINYVNVIRKKDLNILAQKKNLKIFSYH